MYLSNTIIYNSILEANKSPCNSKHSAIITKNSKIIAKGFNNTRTKFLGLLKCSQHAEMDAITKLISRIIKIKKKKNKDKFIKKCRIYIVRINSNNKFMYSPPCKDCFNIIKNLGFNKIYFTNSNGNFEKINTNLFKTNHLSYAQKNYNNLSKKYLKY